MHKVFYIAAIVFFFSCNDQKNKKDNETIPAQEPSEAVIDSLVKDWYAQRIKPGSPSWDVDNVDVLDMSKESQEEGVYHLTLIASGTEYPAAIPEPPAPSKFSDTVKLDLVWKGSYWEILNKPDRQPE